MRLFLTDNIVPSQTTKQLNLTGSYINEGKSATFTTPSNADSYSVMWLAGSKSGIHLVYSNAQFMLVAGTTAPTTYTPYNGQTDTLTLPETVYGGEVDAVSGEGAGTWDFKELKIADMNNLNAFPGWKNQDWLEPYKGTAASGILPGIICNCTSRNKAKYNGNTLYFETSAFNGLTQGELIEKYPDLILQIALLRNAPTPFTATGAQPIPALAGVNTVLTDADSATVTGRADPIKRITDLEDAVASQT